MSTISTPSAFLIKKLETFNLHSDSEAGKLGKKSVRFLGRALTAIEATIEVLVLGTLGAVSAVILELAKDCFPIKDFIKTCEKYQSGIGHIVFGSSVRSLLKALGIIKLELKSSSEGSQTISSFSLNHMGSSHTEIQDDQDDQDA